LFSVLYSFWVANHVAADGRMMRELAIKFLAIAEERAAAVPLIMAHRMMGASLAATGDLVDSRPHFDQSIALFDPAEHRALATRLGHDLLVLTFGYRCVSLWMLGYPDAALADASQAVSDAREVNQAATMLFALSLSGLTQILCGHYAASGAQCDELVALASEKDAVLRKSQGIIQQGCVCSLTGKASNAAELITSGLVGFQSTGATYFVPFYLSCLAKAHAELGQFDAAQSAINGAIAAFETTGERWWEAEVHRMAGEIALMAPKPDATKAEAHFERALEAARKQQAKSWELRAAISMARLWRDQGKRNEARELLAPVYGWFTEGFDTLDLKAAKALLDELALSAPSMALPFGSETVGDSAVRGRHGMHTRS
jgi:predicted ATPase